MKYVLMIGFDAEEPGQRQAQLDDGCEGWTEELFAAGVVESAVGLRPADEATTVRVRGEEVLLTDGPFAETKDQVGGFVVLEAADLDEAIALAARHPSARHGAIEIRPVDLP